MKNVGKIQLGGKKVLIPEMNAISASLFAAAFRSFGVDARVLQTYRGIDLGRIFTSGKECYPCQVTLGDILCFAREEKQRLGEGFRSENYIYFMPESEGPCRFGLYNKYQRIVLDSFPVALRVCGESTFVTAFIGSDAEQAERTGRCGDLVIESNYAITCIALHGHLNRMIP